MLNPNLKLNTKIFNSDVEKQLMREGFGYGLLEAAIHNDNIVGLCADVVDSVKMNIFADKFPERYIETGVAEQNLAGVASGMASMGKIPFIASYAVFNSGRNWEQIRTNICYNDRPVKIIGSHAGVTVGPDGGSHQALEDIAIMRVLPKMVVISPCDALEAKKATIACSKTSVPTYIRLDRNNSPLITTTENPFEIGKAQILFVPETGIAQVGIIATGTVVYQALLAAHELEKNGIKIKVMNLSTIKPLDEEAILALAKETKSIVTVEDHQIAGGMGSAVSEFLAQNYPVPIEFVGIKDRFGQSGTPSELMKEYNIDYPAIINSINKILKRKTS